MISSTGACTPRMLKMPSVTTTARRALPAACARARSSARMSRCGYTTFDSGRARRTALMMELWFSSSEMSAVPGSMSGTRQPTTAA